LQFRNKKENYTFSNQMGIGVWMQVNLKNDYGAETSSKAIGRIMQSTEKGK